VPERYRAFWDAKVGNTPEEFEDAFWPADPTATNDGRRYAVADGATESSYSRHWAQLLADAYGAGATKAGKIVARMSELQQEWLAGHRSAGLPWYASQKLELGAFAALLGVRLTGEGEGRRLAAIAAGDCCLVIVRDGAVDLAWPVARSSDFGSNPALLSSVAPSAGQLALLVGLPHDHDRLVTGDTLFLMTDAIAAWFLREADDGRTPWVTVAGFAATDGEGFVAWARGLRTTGVMRNDDVTVGIIDIE
jgi:hypothetical protein